MEAEAIWGSSSSFHIYRMVKELRESVTAVEKVQRKSATRAFNEGNKKDGGTRNKPFIAKLNHLR